MQNYDLLIQAAELLEKTAAHIESSEAAAYQIATAQQNAAAQKIASNLSGMVGSSVDPQTVTKMAEMGPEVVSLLQKLAGGDRSDRVESMGEPATTEKVASQNGYDADSRLLDFIMS
jgi:hypothetical protein